MDTKFLLSLNESQFFALYEALGQYVENTGEAQDYEPVPKSELERLRAAESMLESMDAFVEMMAR